MRAAIDSARAAACVIASGGRAASAQSIGVTYGAHPRAQLAALEPLALVESVAELSRWMGRR